MIAVLLMIFMTPLMFVGAFARIVWFALSCGWSAGMQFIEIYFGEHAK